MDVHGGALQIHVHIAVALVFPLVVAFALAHARPGMGGDPRHGEIRFFHLNLRSTRPAPFSLDTFSKYLTHYDTFSPPGWKDVRVLSEGEGGFAPAVCGRLPLTAVFPEWRSCP